MSSDARKAAYDALSAVVKDGAYASLALKQHLPAGMAREDKAFASLLVRTVLENLLRIDYALRQFITARRVHGSVKNVLRLGACQILYLDIEGYAAVSESVRLVKKIKPQMSGFVNAVLRALDAGKGDIRYPQGKDAASLSIRASCPVWICEKYMADFGYDFAEQMLMHKPDAGTSVRANTIRTDAASLEQEMTGLGLKFQKQDIPDAYLVQGLSDIEHMPLYSSGNIAVQSASAMRAVLETKVEPGSQLLDCCAAPGGKSAYAAALAGNTLSIVSWDVHAHRVEMTNKNYERLGVRSARAVLHDAQVFQSCLASTFDCVIVDAPCSSMGLMARNPDIRYRRRREDISALAEKQKAILAACAAYVKPGGTLAYYTCSVNKEENEAVTEHFLGGSKRFAFAQPPLTLYPHTARSDGFYIAVMKRTS